MLRGMGGECSVERDGDGSAVLRGMGGECSVGRAGVVH